MRKARANSHHSPAIGRRHMIGLMTAGLGSAAIYQSVQPSYGATDPGLESLIKAAQAEGVVNYYTGLTENTDRRINEAFYKRYGIRPGVVILSGAEVARRYSDEAAAGNIGADVVILAGGADALAALGQEKEWMEPISSSGLPTLTSGEFPARMNPGRSAIISITPWVIGYNTDKVSKAEIPKDYADLLNPKWKGQVLVNDPADSIAYVDFWAVLADHYDASFFEKLRQTIRHVGGPSIGTQALAAGDGAFAIPQTGAQVQLVGSKGAPVGMVTMDLTTGVQNQVMLTARSKSKHPNAGRLFANWVMSMDGNKVVNDDPGAYSVYDTAHLPKMYEPPKPGNAARRDEIRKLMGFA